MEKHSTQNKTNGFPFIKRIEYNDPFIAKLNEIIDANNMHFRMLDMLKNDLQELNEEFTNFVLSKK